MPTATRDNHHVNCKLPKLHTAYQIGLSIPQQSASPASKHSNMPTGTSRELPMPTVSSISGLTQAQATLQHCSARLRKSWQNNPAPSSPPASPIDANERRQFLQWLEQWEKAFTTYLSMAMAGMKAEDVTRCRILKANHLSCIILASDDASARAFDVFDSEFQAIVELASAVIRSRPRLNASPTLESPTDTSPTSSTLDVREPLYVVVARCSRISTRNIAVELLQKTNKR